MPTTLLPRCHALVLFVLVVGLLVPEARAATVSDRERRCLAMIAFAEAVGEGPLGMAAVIRVVRNRVAHPRFADDACSVALENGQFQPVAERAALRQALQAPERLNLAEVLGARSREARLALVEAWRLAGGNGFLAAQDPTRGALYFVNPRLMDPDKCAWFAGLKRTAMIGEHVFMTHYQPGERRGPPALDCNGTVVAARDPGRSVRTPRTPAIPGPFIPDLRYATIATRLITPATIQAWRREQQNIEAARRQRSASLGRIAPTWQRAGYAASQQAATRQAAVAQSRSRTPR